MKVKLFLSVILTGLFFSVFEEVHGQSPNWIWANGIGGAGQDWGGSVSIDNSGNSYMSGYFSNTVDFNPGPGTFNMNAPGSTTAAFITKTDSAGNFVWAKAMKSTSFIIGNAITIDAARNTYTTGFFQGNADLDPSAANFNVTSFGYDDVFVTKLDSLGNFVWGKQMGGTNVEGPEDITTDISGNVYTSGIFFGTCDFDPDSVSVFNMNASVSLGAAFISKLDNDGNFVWAKSISGNDNVYLSSLEADAANNIYVSGYFSGTADFNPDTLVSFYMTAMGTSHDGFIMKLDSIGNFVWARSIGDTELDQIYSIVLDDSANINITGFIQDTVDFDPGPGTFNLISAGYNDIFIARFDSAGNFQTAKAIGGTGFDVGNIIKMDNSGSIYIHGLYKGTVDFDPGPGSFILTSTGNFENSFIAKYDYAFNFVWAKSSIARIFHGNGDIEPDNNNNVIFTGAFILDTIVFDYNVLINANAMDTLSNPNDFFLAKLSICSTSSFISPTGCSSYASPSGNYNWTTTGTYYDTIPNAAGCDSLITVNLILNSSASTQNIATCNNYTSPSGNYNWTSSGTYMDTIPNAAGCDSIITINLTINNSYSIQNISACNNYISPSGNYNWTTSGVYSDTIPNAAGCDSIFTINLTINHESSSNIFYSACDNYHSPSGNYTWTTSGIYSDTIPNATGCDSLITIDLTVNYSSSAFIADTVCGSYISPGGNNTWTTSGIYSDTIPNASGCDSVITINLTIYPLPVALYTLYPDTTIPHNWFALNQCTGTPPLTYVWNWGDSSAVSTGATPSHIYADSGYYNICVTVTDGNGCVNAYCDSSTYLYKGNNNTPVTVNVVLTLPNGIDDMDGISTISIYPVPVKEVLMVSLRKPFMSNSNITISDMEGRVIKEEKITQSNNGIIPINISALSPGVYLLKIDGMVKRFMKM